MKLPKFGRLVTVIVGISCLAAGSVSSYRTLRPEEKATLNITVTDSSGAAVEGADVLLQKSNRQFLGGKAALGNADHLNLQVLQTIEKAKSDKDGIVKIQAAAGRYRISASKSDTGRAGQAIVLEAGKSIDVKLILKKD